MAKPREHDDGCTGGCDGCALAERAAVVAWLRKRARQAGRTQDMLARTSGDVRQIARIEAVAEDRIAAADAIERGEHVARAGEA